MKAFVTSIGESTTDLCIWSLTRQGFDVVLILNPRSLWSKLKDIYEQAEDDFIRVDADVVVNRNIKELIKLKDKLWCQSLTYDWFKQDVTHGGVQFIRKDAIQVLRDNVHKAERLERPESHMFRLEEFHNPRKCGTFDVICGLNGYKQTDIKRVRDTKERRNQTGYDWELAERISAL